MPEILKISPTSHNIDNRKSKEMHRTKRAGPKKDAKPEGKGADLCSSKYRQPKEVKSLEFGKLLKGPSSLERLSEQIR